MSNIEIIDLIVLDGIGGKGEPGQLLNYITEKLVQLANVDGRTIVFNVVYVKWYASIGPVNPTDNPYDIGPWLKESTVNGAHQITKALQQSDRRAFILGYSGGAGAASRWMEWRSQGNIDACIMLLDKVVLGTVLMANPWCCPDETGNYGIAGIHEPFERSGIPHLELAYHADGIPRCPEYGPLRLATDMGMEGTVEDWMQRCFDEAWQIVIPPLPELPTRWSNWRYWFDPEFFRIALAEAKVARKIAEDRAEAGRRAQQAWLGAYKMLKDYLDGYVHGWAYRDEGLMDEAVQWIWKLTKEAEHERTASA